MGYLSENMSEEEALKILDDYKYKIYVQCTKVGGVGIPNEEWYAIDRILDLYKAEKEKNVRLTKDNLDLNMLYRRTASHFQEKGKFELADYMLAQIGAVPTWTDFDDYSNWISKDKIEAIIKELDKDIENTTREEFNKIEFAIVVLEELLERRLIKKRQV